MALEKSAFFVVITLGRLIMLWCVSTVGCPLGQHYLDLLSCIKVHETQSIMVGGVVGGNEFDQSTLYRHMNFSRMNKIL